MNIKIRKNRKDSASALVITLVTSSILGFVLASYLTLVRAQYASTVRAQAWNAALPAAEAGIEEALAHINSSEMANWGANGWTLSGSSYTKSRTFSDYSWTAQILATDPPTIIATGQAPTVVNNSFFASIGLFGASPTNFVERKVRATTRRDGLFTKAMVAKDTIDLNGNNIRSDSFDSTNPLYSTNGLFDPNVAKLRDNGDIATNSGITNSLTVGNADIWGHASTGPGGAVSVGTNGAVGSKTWNLAGNHGIQPGWTKDDMNVSFPDVTVPFVGGFTPASGTLGGTNYKYLLTTGNYVMSTLSLSGHDEILVTGKAKLLVTSGINITGQGQITVASNATLTVYMRGGSAAIGGNGLANATGNATNFVFLGLPSHNSLSFSGNGTFTGVVYAPNANFTLNGGGSGDQDFVGASVTKTVKMNGHFKFHYDENLGRSQFSRGYIVVGWDEL